jgi:hypothetical protein
MPPNMRLKLSVRALDIGVHPLLGAARGPQLKRDSLGISEVCVDEQSSHRRFFLRLVHGH